MEKELDFNEDVHKIYKFLYIPYQCKIEQLDVEVVMLRLFGSHFP